MDTLADKPTPVGTFEDEEAGLADRLKGGGGGGGGGGGADFEQDLEQLSPLWQRRLSAGSSGAIPQAFNSPCKIHHAVPVRRI